MSWWTDTRRGLAKIGGGALAGYISGGGNWGSALGGAATSAALGGLDSKRGFNTWRNIAAPAVVGYGIGQTQTGQFINEGLQQGFNNGTGFVDTAGRMLSNTAGAGKAGLAADYAALTGAGGGLDTIKGMLLTGGEGNKTSNGSSSLLGDALHIGGGALAAKMMAPPIPQYRPTDKATLDAATLVEMRRRAAERMAVVNGQLSAQGGLSSTGMYQQALAQQNLDQNIAKQSALNTISSNATYNDLLARSYAAQRQNAQDILSGGIAGYNIGQPTGG